MSIPADPGADDRTVLSIYDDGHFETHGSVAGEVEGLLRMPSSLRNLLVSDDAPADSMPDLSHATVFCVYGHDLRAKAELEAMLRRWSLEPLFLDQLPSVGMTLIEKLEHLWDRVAFAVVLSTPDDVGFRAGRQENPAYRARQNVVLELGMMLARLGRARVAILLKQMDATFERPSDIDGLIYIPFREHVDEAATKLAKEMHSQGIVVDVTKL